MAISPDQLAQYIAYARDPETWILAARRNLAAFRVLLKHYEVTRTAKDYDFIEVSGCLFSSYLHGGAAVENAAKAVLVGRDPSIVTSDGSLKIKAFGTRSGHALLDPVRGILVTLSNEETRVLTKLEEAVWLGRYALPTTANALFEKMDLLRYSGLDDAGVVHELVQRLLACVGPKHAA